MISIKYSIYEEKDLISTKNFVILELLNTLKEKGLTPKKIIYINSIFVSKEDRLKKKGSLLIKELVEKNKGSVFITEAFASKEEYEKQPTEDENEKIIKGIGTFLNKNNFHDINDYVGKFDYKKVYIYNEFYKDVILGIKKEQ